MFSINQIPARRGDGGVACPTMTTTRNSPGTHKVVAAYPHTAWAERRIFLSGLLEFNQSNRGSLNYRRNTIKRLEGLPREINILPRSGGGVDDLAVVPRSPLLPLVGGIKALAALRRAWGRSFSVALDGGKWQLLLASQSTRRLGKQGPGDHRLQVPKVTKYPFLVVALARAWPGFAKARASQFPPFGRCPCRNQRPRRGSRSSPPGRRRIAPSDGPEIAPVFFLPTRLGAAGLGVGWAGQSSRRRGDPVAIPRAHTKNPAGGISRDAALRNPKISRKRQKIV